MAFRIEQRAGALLIGLVMAPTIFAQQAYRYEAWRGHRRLLHIGTTRDAGVLEITESGLSFVEAQQHGNHARTWHWSYQDIHQLRMGTTSLDVLTYQANRWKAGAEREYEFDLVSDKTFGDAYLFLKSRLDQRFVATIADGVADVLWEVPVKHLLRFGEDEGMLQVSANEIVYNSPTRNASRTWRYQDIENISTSGPFQLTVTTFERATLHFGDLKWFNFELKSPLVEARYNGLWLRVNESKGLKLLDSYRVPDGKQ